MESRNATPAILDLIAATRVGRGAQRQQQEEDIWEKKREEAYDLDEEKMEGDEVRQTMTREKEGRERMEEG